MPRPLLQVAGIVGALALLTGACAKNPPQAVPEPPAALEVPVPPPRVLAPVAPADPPPMPVEEPPADPPRPTRPRPAARPAGSGTDARPEPGRPEGPPADAAPAVPPEARPETATPALRTPQTANDAASEKKIRDVLQRTRGSLRNVARAQLSSDAQVQYDTAGRFLDQAEDALKVRNYMFAAYLADKAETLARGLTGR